MKSMKFFRRISGVPGIIPVIGLILMFNMLMAMQAKAYSIAEYAARVDPAGLGKVLNVAASVPAVANSIARQSGVSGGGGGGSGEPTIIPPIEITRWEWEEVWIEPEEGYEGYFEWQWVPHTVLWYPSPEQYNQLCTKEPIDTATGNNYFTEERLHVPCPGIPLAVDLKYQSSTNILEGSLGKGWRHSYEWSLADQTTNAAIHMPSGGKMVFELGTNGLYKPPENVKWELAATTNGYDATAPSEGLTYSFATNGTLTTIHDVWGNQVQCSYGTNGCLEAVTHANGRQILFSNEWHTASSEWRVSDIQIVGGASLALDYNGDGQLEQIVEQVGANSYTSSYLYADGFLTNKINGAGFEYSFGYEEVNGILNGKGTGLDVNGYYEHDLSYDDFSTDVTYHRRGTNQIFRYVRNDEGLPDTTYGPVQSIDDIEIRGTRYVYATNGMDTIEETLFDDEAGAAWSKWMCYDDKHNVTNFAVSYCTTNPVWQLTTEYDPVTQLPTAVVDADNLRLEVVFTNGLPLVEKAFFTESNSYDTCYSYTTNGLVQTVTNANGHVSSFSYDSMGNLIAASAELGPVATNTYNALGFVQNVEILSESGASMGRITQYEKDAKGRVLQTIFADGLTNRFYYNALGYLTNSVDRAGRRTDYTYAPTKKLTSVTKYLKQGGAIMPVCIGYDFDEQMNMLSITEPRGRYVESYQLDVQDRVTSVTNIEGQVMDIDYSVSGFVTQLTRFDGATITNTYDNAGQKESTTYNPGGANPLTINYSYYPDGLIKSMSDGLSSVSNSYNRLNRLTNSSVQALSVQYQVSNVFDSVGNVTNAVVSIEGTPVSTTSYKYDVAECLTDIFTTEGVEEEQRFVYEYNTDNGLVALVSNTVSGIICSYAYDIMDRTTNITYRTGVGSLIRSLDYTYDAVSMITNKVVNDGYQSMTNSYRYDSLDRLVFEEQSGSVSSAYSVAYSYDLAGNRLTKTIDGLGVAYSLGDGNRLASAGVIGVIDVGGSSTETIGTDNQWGELKVTNLTAQVGWMPEVNGTDFWIDNLPLVIGTNQIVAAIRDQAGNTDYTTNTVFMSADSTNMQYAYNAAGCMTNLNGISLEWDKRYRLKNVDGAFCSVEYEYDLLNRRTSRIEGSDTNYFIYDGNQVVADLDGNGNILRTYVWGSGIDNLLCFTDCATSNTYYAIKDHQNSVIALVDENGSVVESYDYDAWGNVQIYSSAGQPINSSTVRNRYLFQGREYDSTTGLYYFRARWYDPETGRWLSKDQIGISGGLNQYEFCGNNSVNFLDSFGRAPGDVYSSVNAAAIAACSDIYGPSTSGDVEMGGWIIATDGGYTYTDPVTGGVDHVNIGSKPAEAAAWYHSHGSDTEGYNDYHFSGRHQQPFFPGDKGRSFIWKLNAYLVTPDGNVLKYSFSLSDDNETIIGKVSCVE